MGYERDKRLGLNGLSPEQRAARLEVLQRECEESAARQELWGASCDIVNAALAAAAANGAVISKSNEGRQEWGNADTETHLLESGASEADIASCFPFLADGYFDEPTPAVIERQSVEVHAAPRDMKRFLARWLLWNDAVLTTLLGTFVGGSCLTILLACLLTIPGYEVLSTSAAVAVGMIAGFWSAYRITDSAMERLKNWYWRTYHVWPDRD